MPSRVGFAGTLDLEETRKESSQVTILMGKEQLF